MAYYLEYDDKVLSDFTGFGVISVSMPALPPLVSSEKDIWGRNGSLFCGSKRDKREIKLEFNILTDNLEDYEETKDNIEDTFDVDTPKAFYFGNQEKFIYCIPEGDVNIDDVVINDNGNVYYGKGNLTLIAYDPYFYSEDAKIYVGTKEITYINEGKKPCPCEIDIIVESDSANYIQVNDNKNNAILIGNYPTLGISSIKDKENSILDECEATSNFINGALVDASRSVTGGIDKCSINEGGYAITASDYGSGDSWHGPCIRKNLSSDITDFEVKASFYFDSTGQLNYNEVCSTDKVSTTKYKVSSTSVILRQNRSSNSKSLSSIKKNTYLYPTEVVSGWIKTTYNGLTGWIKISTGLKKVTVTTANYYTNRCVNMRASASKKSKLLKTIPSGTHVLCYPNSVSGNYTKCKYKGVNGYIYSDYLTQGSDTTIETDEEITIAENQIGLLELYGYDNLNNKLFKFALCDDNEYYEATYPMIQVGNNEFLKDSDFSVPDAKIHKTVEGDKDKLTIKTETLNSGAYGNWNAFKGIFKIIRKKGIWSAEVAKYDVNGKLVKTIKSDNIINENYPVGDLNHIEVFFGAYADKDIVENIGLDRIEINKLNSNDETEVNTSIFSIGDVVKIDTANGEIKKNNEDFTQYIDIGSNFFDLDPGENTINIYSDADIKSSIIFNEKFNSN